MSTFNNIRQIDAAFADPTPIASPIDNVLGQLTLSQDTTNTLLTDLHARLSSVLVPPDSKEAEAKNTANRAVSISPLGDRIDNHVQYQEWINTSLRELIARIAL